MDGLQMKSPLPSALSFEVVKRCSVTRARAAIIHLPHYSPNTPMFMPVATKGSMKGVLPCQLEEIDCELILANTYHLMLKPGEHVLREASGLHPWMGWRRAMLTDSGGFQMVSLAALSSVDEEGVSFSSHYDNSQVFLLTPERSIAVQQAIGADIMMQLDDVVNPLSSRERIEEAMLRSIRWLDRCIQAHTNKSTQNLFPIIQGGLYPELRNHCITEMIKRDMPGYAIGGLSGGEDKHNFWPIIKLCAESLPADKPRYCMGVGYAVDMVVCTALGVDMYDCVYPTRTARFGRALVPSGNLNLKNNMYMNDHRPIDSSCCCFTCKTVTRSYLFSIMGKETVAATYVSIHNIAYNMNLMRSMRSSIIEDRFPQFVKKFFADMFPTGIYPTWAVDALASVNVNLLDLK